MHIIRATGVTDALQQAWLLWKFHPIRWRQISPGGKRTFEFVEPVCTVYDDPMDRWLIAPWPVDHERNVEAGKLLITGGGEYGPRIVQGDQINKVVSILEVDPDSRQAVIDLWDAAVPCNTHIYFKPREGRLHMTVCNRSNDFLFKAYNNNMVQFSMLQEHIALRLGMHMGVYRQISDSFHFYPDTDLGRAFMAITNIWSPVNLNDHPPA